MDLHQLSSPTTSPSAIELTAYSLLSAIGDETVATSIQCFNSETSAFETATYDEDGIVIGVDFSIEPGKGYILYMKEDLLNFHP